MTPKFVRGEQLSLINGFADDVVENSIMRVPVARVPITITTGVKGEVSAIVYFATPQKNAFAISRVERVTSKHVTISATYKGKNPAPKLLKTIVLPAREARGLRIGPKTALHIDTYRGTDGMLHPRRLKRMLATTGEEALTEVAGVFVTTRPWWANLRKKTRATISNMQPSARKLREVGRVLRKRQ